MPVSAAPAAPQATAGAGRGRGAQVVALSVITAAGWGFAPVLIELAANANGGASSGMMVGSQALGALLLGGIMLLRRSPILVRPLTPTSGVASSGSSLRPARSRPSSRCSSTSSSMRSARSSPC